MDPLLSIIIPSYNYGRFLPHALDSILAQDFSNFEVILIDDGSKDESPSLSERYAAQDSRIQYIGHKENGGIFLRAEEGLKKAKGKYIHYFSADDVYLPHFLSQCMRQFELNPRCGLVCCDIGYFQDGTKQIEIKKLLKKQNSPIFFAPTELAEVFQNSDFWVPGSACIVKKELVQKHEAYIPSLENISDWFLFHRIALFEGITYIPENLLAMRVHDNTYTKQVKKNKKRRRNTFWHLLKILEQRQDVREKFKESALLSFVFKELSWRVQLNPRYWDYLPPIWKKNKNK